MVCTTRPAFACVLSRRYSVGRVMPVSASNSATVTPSGPASLRAAHSAPSAPGPSAPAGVVSAV